MTLLELLVVLMILIATALIVVPTFYNLKIKTPTGNSESPETIVTKATMRVTQDAIAGEGGVIETLAHQSNALPREIRDLTREAAPEYLLSAVPALANYDPVLSIGWHGPYLLPTGREDSGEPTIVDGWGNEIVIQVDFDQDGLIDRTEAKYIRVVSAGPNGKIDTPSDIRNMIPGGNEFGELTLSECGDDIVVFLRVPDQRVKKLAKYRFLSDSMRGYFICSQAGQLQLHQTLARFVSNERQNHPQNGG